MSEIQHYADACETVQAVELPEIQEHGTNNATYPPFVLDAASGVGKTQQAFALSKRHGPGSLCYCHNGPIGDRGQRIYVEMERELGLNTFLSHVDAAMEELQTKAKEKAKKSKSPASQSDAFSVINLQITLQGKFKPTLYPKLDALIQAIGRLRDITTGLSDVEDMLDEALGGGAEETKAETFSLTQMMQSVNQASTSTGSLLNELKDVILFIDEALPKTHRSRSCGGSGDDWRRKEAIRRLRFMRNLGRAVGMRVVLAGTAATIANIICDYFDEETYAQSRKEGNNEMCWAVCEFFWLTATKSSINWCTDENIRALLSEGRPLVAREIKKWKSYLDDLPRGLLTALRKLGEELREKKKPPEEAQLDWLSGAWLDGTHTPPSLYQMKPTELVQHHFFEPAIAVSRVPGLPEESVRPHLGLGLESVGRVTGPRRAFVDHQASDEKTVWWCFTTTETSCKVRPPRVGPENTAICKDFAGVEYALSHCVQQCLAREPLLAVALSFWSCTVSPSMLHSLIAASWFETKNQRTVGAIDGELNEAFCFIVLQLAANYESGGDGNTQTAETFVSRIHKYLKLQPKENEYDRMASRFGYTGPAPKNEELIWNYCRPGEEKKVDTLSGEKKERETSSREALKERLNTIPIPHLVPACSEAELKKKIEKQPHLFGDDAIAGLIPGPTLSLLDASMMVWEEKAKISWKFEFKSRAGDYYSLKGKKDLEEKIGDDTAELEREISDLTRKIAEDQETRLGRFSRKMRNKRKVIERQKIVERLDQIKATLDLKRKDRACHAMLIAVKNSGKPTVHVWSVEGGQNEDDAAMDDEEGTRKESYLRVVLVVPCPS